MTRVALAVFAIASIGELVAGAFGSQYLEFVSKPLLMISLGIYYTTKLRASGVEIAPAVVIAIVFSFLGDVLLMLQYMDELFFLLGLASFLVAHLSYIRAYRLHQRQDDEGRSLYGTQKVRFALPIVLATTGLISILYNHLGGLKLPVIIYALVLMWMTLQALFRFGKTGGSSFWCVLAGAMLFMSSDAMIAINKFLSPLPLSDLLIMSAYIIGQFLIISGLILHAKQKR
ncbi:MAG: lysoplasmalogenase [Cyclobacteriaceae bacterium]